jgi:hypothetical protein
MHNFIDSDNQPAQLSIGTRVDVHTRFEFGRWVSGFTIAEARDGGYRIRRVSDGAVLGETIQPEEVRAANVGPTRSHDLAPTTEVQQ